MQDGVAFHWAPEAHKAAERLNVDLVPDYPARSPSLNPPENMFGWAMQKVDSRFWKDGPPTSEGEELKRFRDACEDYENKGFLDNAIRSVPDRLKLIIENKGGPIPY